MGHRFNSGSARADVFTYSAIYVDICIVHCTCVWVLISMCVSKEERERVRERECVYVCDVWVWYVYYLMSDCCNQSSIKTEQRSILCLQSTIPAFTYVLLFIIYVSYVSVICRYYIVLDNIAILYAHTHTHTHTFSLCRSLLSLKSCVWSAPVWR